MSDDSRTEPLALRDGDRVTFVTDPPPADPLSAVQGRRDFDPERVNDSDPAYVVVSAGEIEAPPWEPVRWVEEWVPPPPVDIRSATLEPTEAAQARAGLVYEGAGATVSTADDYTVLREDADRLYVLVQALAAGVVFSERAITPGVVQHAFPVPVIAIEPALRLDGWVGELHLWNPGGAAVEVRVLTCSRPRSTPLR